MADNGALAKQILSHLAAGRHVEAKKIANNITDPTFRTKATSAIDRSKQLKATAAKTGQGDKGPKLTGILGYMQTLDQLNVALVKSNAAFGTTQGAIAGITTDLMNLQAANVDLGYKLTDLHKIYGDVSQQLASRVRPGFDKHSMQLTQQVALWKRLGVSVSDSTEFINTFDTVFGSSRQEIEKTGRTLHAFAVRTGQPVQKIFQAMARDSKNFFDILDSGEVTRQTLIFQARAKAMGSSVGELVGLLDKFETMQGAQTAGAKLNATMSALGGSFDAVKASTLDYPERMEYIASAVQKVLPRIRQAGPRAQRLYMRSMRESLGVDAKMMRKLMTFKPGDMLSVERELTAGRMPSMRAGDQRAAARAGTFATQQVGALKDAASIERLLTRTLANAGISAAGMVSVGKEFGSVAAQTLVTQVVSRASLWAGKEGKKFLADLGFTTTVDDVLGKATSFAKLVDKLNIQQNKLITSNTTTLAKVIQ